MSRKKKKGISRGMIAFIAIVVVVGGLIWLGSSNKGSEESSSTGVLSISESSWKLGTVSMKDGIDTKEIELVNNSDSPVTITSMETSCMCTEATVVREDGTEGPTKGMPGHGGTSYMSEEIAAGSMIKLLVKFNPNAHGPNAVGPINRSVTLKTDSAKQSKINLRFSGVVTK